MNIYKVTAKATAYDSFEGPSHYRSLETTLTVAASSFDGAIRIAGEDIKARLVSEIKNGRRIVVEVMPHETLSCELIAHVDLVEKAQGVTVGEALNYAYIDHANRSQASL